MPEALDALCRAEAWTAVANLLGRDGSALSDGAAAWMSAVPPTMLRNDPWLILARARSLRAQGHFRAAVDAYGAAEAPFGDADGAATAGLERAPMLPWLDPDPPRALPGVDASDRAGSPSSALRAATIRDPGPTAMRLADRTDPAERLVAGLSALLAGDPARAQGILAALAEAPDASGLVTVAAELGTGVARALRGDLGGATDIEAGIAAAEAMGVEWLERIGRACLTLVGARCPGRAARGGCRGGIGGRLGRGADGVTRGLVDTRCPRAAGAADRGRDGVPPPRCAGPGGLGTRAAGTQPRPHRPPRGRAGRVGRGCPGPDHGCAAGSRSGPAGPGLGPGRSVGRAGRVGPLDARGCRPGGARLGRHDRATDVAARGRTGHRRTIVGGVASSPAAGLVEARCLGNLELIIDGQPVDLATARPRVRSLLRLLLSEPGAPFHHEVVAEAFWPEAEPEVGARNLHAAVAALRRLVEPGVARGSFQLVVRDGASYRFVVAPGSRVDVLQFDRAVEAARLPAAAGDDAARRDGWREALALYRGDLLADEGPASWLEAPRERRRQHAVEAAEAVARACFARGDLDDAARLCTQGLRIDRYHDPLWRLLIAVRERAGDQGAARRARQGYDKVLVELGVTADDADACGPRAQRMALNSSSRMATGWPSGPVLSVTTSFRSETSLRSMRCDCGSRLSARVNGVCVLAVDHHVQRPAAAASRRSRRRSRRPVTMRLPRSTAGSKCSVMVGLLPAACQAVAVLPSMASNERPVATG